MNTSLVLAQILGIMFAVIGLSMLFNGSFTAAVVEEIAHSKGLIWLAGLLALLMGAVLVSLNNVWNSGWVVIITIIGWLALVKGIVILIFPKATAKFYTSTGKTSVFALGGLVVLVLGVILLYAGFM